MKLSQYTLGLARNPESDKSFLVLEVTSEVEYQQLLAAECSVRGTDLCFVVNNQLILTYCKLPESHLNVVDAVALIHPQCEGMMEFELATSSF